MREIISDRTKKCKNYNKILSKIASKQIRSVIAPVKTQMLIKMPVDFWII
jgi:hypothetical protein